MIAFEEREVVTSLLDSQHLEHVAGVLARDPDPWLATGLPSPPGHVVRCPHRAAPLTSASTTSPEGRGAPPRLLRGYGYLSEFDVERFHRETLLMTGEGMNATQRNLVFPRLVFRFEGV